MAHGDLKRLDVKLAPVRHNGNSETEKQRCWHKFIIESRAIGQEGLTFETEKTSILSKHKNDGKLNS